MQPNSKALYHITQNPWRKDGGQLALQVQIKNDTLMFYDTNRGHMIHGKLVEEYENGFAFEAFEQEGAWVNGLWIFREVTIQDFRQHLCQAVGHGEVIAKTINTTEELWEWYRKTFPL